MQDLNPHHVGVREIDRGAELMNFQDWLEHFQNNPIRHSETEAEVDWDAPLTMDERTQRAFIRSFQRFELGESGDGKHLLSNAALAGDNTYLAALELLVKEEQKHSALFRRGLDRLHAQVLQAHWSDRLFVALRRMLGLRTELGLFLIVESVSLGYMVALADNAPDSVLRGIGRRIVNDEKDHIRFQIDRLRQGFEYSSQAVRKFVGATWIVLAAGATTVLWPVADRVLARRHVRLPLDCAAGARHGGSTTARPHHNGAPGQARELNALLLAYGGSCSTDDALIDTGDFLASGASEAMLRILDRGMRPTAVFGANGPTTLGAVRALQERLGPDWGKSVAVVSFDDLDWFEFASPPISAVRNDATTIGRLGVTALVELIEGRPAESYRVPTEFVDLSSAQ
jgi:hypothetical protein